MNALRRALIASFLLTHSACSDGSSSAGGPGGASGTGGAAGSAGKAGGGSGGVAGAAGSSAAGAGNLPTNDQILAASWQALPGAPTISGKQDDLYFVTPELGWSVNGLGEIHRTADGGATFTELVNRPGTYFRAVVFVDEQHGFFGNIGPDYFPNVTDDIPLYETIDGGATVTPVTTISGPSPKGICNFDKLDDLHLFASGRVGGPSFFLKSTDGGKTWTSTDLTSQIAMLIDVHFVTPSDGFLIGGTSTNPGASKTIVLSTKDGGDSWTTAFESTTLGELGWKFSFPSSTVGYASVLGYGASSSFLKTTDGGVTWQQLPLVSGGYQTKGIGFITEDIGWVGGEPPNAKPAYRTSDGGATWHEAPDLGPLVNRFRFVDAWTGYAIGTTVFKLDIAAAKR